MMILITVMSLNTLVDKQNDQCDVIVSTSIACLSVSVLIVWLHL